MTNFSCLKFTIFLNPKSVIILSIKTLLASNFFQAVFPFPKQYAQWKEGCFMYEPGVIPTNRGPHSSQVQLDRLPSSINFRVSIPKAEAVAVVAGQNWTHLDRLQVNKTKINNHLPHSFDIHI